MLNVGHSELIESRSDVEAAAAVHHDFSIGAQVDGGAEEAILLVICAEAAGVVHARRRRRAVALVVGVALRSSRSQGRQGNQRRQDRNGHHRPLAAQHVDDL